MIAKLIVRGPTREVAIQKLHGSLSEYEVAGPITNIEFLKRVCETPAFIEGDVETGFITKWKEPLFAKYDVDPEIYAQAALGTFLLERSNTSSVDRSSYAGQAGFVPSFQDRAYTFLLDGGGNAPKITETVTTIRMIASGLFDITVGGTLFSSVAAQYDGQQHTVVSYFPHTRLATRFIADEDQITLFHQGKQRRLRMGSPGWISKALGVQETAHSVLAPMPCKILRVEVQAGEEVKKDQALVVIESMKMETVIRSPQDGVVSKVVHQAGVSALVDVLRFALMISTGVMQSWDCVD